jgi:hypothetical protein
MPRPAWVREWKRSEEYMSHFSCHYGKCTGSVKIVHNSDNAIQNY